MASTVDLSVSGDGKAVNANATIGYTRSGSQITVTITINVISISDNTNRVDIGIDGTSVRLWAPGYDSYEGVGTTTKKYTYTNSNAVSYSYNVTIWMNAYAGYNGHTNSGTLTVSVPAATADPYVNVNGTWKKGQAYINVNGSWKEGLIHYNSNGTWKI